jgi:hypothetical protein
MIHIFNKVGRESSTPDLVSVATIPERGIAVVGIFTPTFNINAVKEDPTSCPNVLQFSRLENSSTLVTVNGACAFAPPPNPASSKSKSNSSKVTNL